LGKPLEDCFTFVRNTYAVGSVLGPLAESFKLWPAFGMKPRASTLDRETSALPLLLGAWVRCGWRGGGSAWYGWVVPHTARSLVKV